MRKWIIQSFLIAATPMLITMQIGRAEESKNKEIESYPFNPTEIVKQLQSADVAIYGNEMVWQKQEGTKGLVGWEGESKDGYLYIRIVPEQIMLGGRATIAQEVANLLIAVAAVNKAVFPEDYEIVNKEILIDLIEKAAANLDESQSTMFQGLRLEAGKTSSGLFAYAITRDPVFQKPSEFTIGTPEHTFASYVWAWKNEQWNEMVRYCQITWRSKETDPAEKLKAHHGWCTPISFRIIDKSGGPGFVTIRYELEIKFGGVTDKKEKKANVIKETAPYKASPDGKFGTWGVNPLSAL